jgi:hypothetical protein
MDLKSKLASNLHLVFLVMPIEFSSLGKYVRAYVDFSYLLLLIVSPYKGGSCLGLSVF